jgi:hypothetical protein
MSSELWLPVIGFQNYEISSQGRVRNSKTGFAMKTLTNTTKQSFVRLYGGGYGAKNAYIGQMVLAAFIGPRPEGLEVSHLNMQQSNNRLENLAYETKSAIMKRAWYANGNKQTSDETRAKIKALYATGLSLNGIQKALNLTRNVVQNQVDGRGTAKKLTAVKAQEIRERCDAGELQRVVAVDYGVTTACVNQIARRIIWSPGPP